MKKKICPGISTWAIKYTDLKLLLIYVHIYQYYCEWEGGSNLRLSVLLKTGIRSDFKISFNYLILRHEQNSFVLCVMHNSEIILKSDNALLRGFFIPVVLVQKIVNKKSSKIKYVSNFLKSYLNLLRFFQFTRSSNRSDFLNSYEW